MRDLTASLPASAGMLAVVEGWTEFAPMLRLADEDAPAYPLGEVRLHAPIPEPRRNIFCVGKNYRDHAVEFSRSGYDDPNGSEALPTHPILFSKATTSVTGPYDDIEPHRAISAELDYEAELAVIVGHGGRSISRDRALDHVWGYTIINDLTARDLQRAHKQWLVSKSLDTYAPMGPYVVTADEIVDATALRVESWVNGEPRQSALVKDLIFDIPELITTLSAGLTLLPGDIIATGTPAGVGIGFDPPRFLVSGDVVETSITGLGCQRNRIA